MPTSSSSSSAAQAAREALAARLAHLMRGAGLTGRALSARCGWHPAKTSRILTAKATPCDADLRTWTTACGAEEQAEDLIATARAGMRRAQDDALARTAASLTCRVYASNVIPGFFQTAPYASALLRTIAGFQGTPDDAEEAVAARLARARYLYEGRHRFVVLLEEWVLHSRIGTREEMAGQLAHLLNVMLRPSVSLGIIPLGSPRAVWPLEAFYRYDQQAVIETLTASITVRQPRELAVYARAHAALSRARPFVSSTARPTLGRWPSVCQGGRAGQ
ncbi:DUF5753 domain-containing protein [Streptomyces xiamenensis]|uniref:DUF5753 domain-containing protein n=1 Tax=Streptomyces xiamenensis TaxID=408015 RepID=UPI003D70AA43